MHRDQLGYLSRFRKIAAEDGVAAALERAVGLVHAQLGMHSALSRRRITLSKRVFRKLGGVVRYGPLAGLNIRLKATWGAGDRAGMLLGLYEREVVDTLAEALRKRPIFIDIGAADGYYAVGLVKAGLAQRSVAFEMSAEARRSIRSLAVLNGVEDSVSICGAADAGSLGSLLEVNSFDQCVILCDIEGAETQVLNDRALQLISKAVIVIEVHRADDLGEKEVEDLLRRRASLLFDIEALESGPRAPLQIPELASFSEDDQWLICSEGRGYRQTWLVLRPKV